jgi:hypothetical protein
MVPTCVDPTDIAMDVPGGISPLELHSSPASCTIPNWHQHRPRSIKISKRILSISYHDLRVVAMTAVAEFYDIIARISIEGRSNEIFNDHTFIINHGIAFNALPVCYFTSHSNMG